MSLKSLIFCFYSVLKELIFVVIVLQDDIERTVFLHHLLICIKDGGTGFLCFFDNIIKRFLHRSEDSVIHAAVLVFFLQKSP